jgi:branched-subunit amino acid aminotransferase/4-amino-4-deoxychorismate lyase
VFWIKEGTLYTPSLKTGCIEGVMRARILELCKKNKIKLTECEAKEDALKKADALFFSNVNGLVPAQKLASKKYDLQHPIFEVLQSMV